MSWASWQRFCSGPLDWSGSFLHQLRFSDARNSRSISVGGVSLSHWVHMLWQPASSERRWIRHFSKLWARYVIKQQAIDPTNYTEKQFCWLKPLSDSFVVCPHSLGWGLNRHIERNHLWETPRRPSAWRNEGSTREETTFCLLIEARRLAYWDGI